MSVAMMDAAGAARRKARQQEASTSTTGSSVGGEVEEAMEERVMGSEWDDGFQTGWEIPLEACQ
eukprot:4502215-Pleurochrysis_carterae.AAC.1